MKVDIYSADVFFNFLAMDEDAKTPWCAPDDEDAPEVPEELVEEYLIAYKEVEIDDYEKGCLLEGGSDFGCAGSISWIECGGLK